MASKVEVPCIKVAILTVSDRCHAKKAEDKSGSKLRQLISENIFFPGQVVHQDCVPDEVNAIKEKLLAWADSKEVDLILTTGGTGFSPRDVTPEATREILDREAPGLNIAMVTSSLEITPLAMLSRPSCGIRGGTLIVNLPGSSKAATECLRFVAGALPHAVDLLQGRMDTVEVTHREMQVAVAMKEVRDKASPLREAPPSVTKPHIHRSNSLVDETQVANRLRKSPFPMISVAAAVDIVLKEADMLNTHVISYKDALGHVLADDVYAKDALPPFPASVKDGYAVVAADGAGNRKVLGHSTAGSKPDFGEVIPGHCIRISTGAPVPKGADAVIEVEQTELVKSADEGRTELEVKILHPPTIGQDIRPVGCDIKANNKVLSAQSWIGPSEVGLLATIGVTKVKVYKKPVVAIVSTGNELVDPGVQLKRGQIRDSNRCMIESLLEQGNFEVIDMGIIKDTPGSILEALTNAMEKADVVVTTGGVSMGEKDLLKQVLQIDLRARIHFGRVFMKPGKPTTFATVNTEIGKKLFFCLPGNPVSAMVTCNLYVVPALRKLSSRLRARNTIIKAKLGFTIDLDPRPEYHRAIVSWVEGDDLPVGETTGVQDSSRLLSTRSANGLLLLPAKTDEQASLPAGHVVDCMIIGRM
ncbi:PREDICTED: gephyrin-like [Priapulus caudatus]|uniref:Gephyrin-like n=1 Tax=Priapulus caudatus TaxID=37621 RepID=A0ABM1DW71_PRICU|nr:PREDICTED: gephyrin-like [Priapulus caudatus]